ncbi:hypothetical protein PoB_000417700 [Plakobranchus ocellatus]|uniref:Globin n=1 Tax=Plakobranchus ocellatus TaxID=259542 RepID=A0AAV3Y4L7_9GAST|nr:hypothetical protein PoB_000417700 [Plakobranchus ocellatus]
MRDKFHQHCSHGNTAMSELLQQESFAAHSLVVLLSLDSLVSLVYKPDRLLTTMTDILLSHVHRHENTIDVNFFYRFGHSFSTYIQQQRHLQPNDEEVLVWDKFMTSLIKAADKVVTSRSSSLTEARLAKRVPCCNII